MQLTAHLLFIPCLVTFASAANTITFYKNTACDCSKNDCLTRAIDDTQGHGSGCVAVASDGYQAYTYVTDSGGSCDVDGYQKPKCEIYDVTYDVGPSSK